MKLFVFILSVQLVQLLQDWFDLEKLENKMNLERDKVILCHPTIPPLEVCQRICL